MHNLKLTPSSRKTKLSHIFAILLQYYLGEQRTTIVQLFYPHVSIYESSLNHFTIKYLSISNSFIMLIAVKAMLGVLLMQWVQFSQAYLQHYQPSSGTTSFYKKLNKLSIASFKSNRLLLYANSASNDDNALSIHRYSKDLLSKYAILSTSTAMLTFSTLPRPTHAESIVSPTVTSSNSFQPSSVLEERVSSLASDHYRPGILQSDVFYPLWYK